MKKIVIIGELMLVPYLFDEGFMRVRKDVYEPEQQTFTYQQRDDQGNAVGPMMHIAVNKVLTQINANPQAYRLIYANVNPEQAEHVMRHNGVEMDYVARLTYDKLKVPGILLQWGDDSCTVIDGNHRYVRLQQLGIDEMPFWVVTPAQVKQSLLALPDEFSVF